MMLGDILEAARGDGLGLRLGPPGSILVSGKPEMIAQWVSRLRARKPEIIRQIEAEMILGWLTAIDATGDWTDPCAVDELLQRARHEPGVWAYFLKRALASGGAT